MTFFSWSFSFNSFHIINYEVERKQKKTKNKEQLLFTRNKIDKMKLSKAHESSYYL